MYLCALDLGCQVKPALIEKQIVFAAEFAAISGASTSMLVSSRCRYACRVNASPILHDLVVLAEPS